MISNTLMGVSLSWCRKERLNECIAAFVAQYRGMIARGAKANPEETLTIAADSCLMRCGMNKAVR
jgi:hypothetical protein